MGVLIIGACTIYGAGAGVYLIIGLINLFDTYSCVDSERWGYRVVRGGFLVWPLMALESLRTRLAEVREEMNQ